MKPTLVIGASDLPRRYSFRAITELQKYGHPVFALALEKGIVGSVEFETEWNSDWEVDTVTLYINPSHQPQYYERIIALKPKRVIFNPGTENAEFVLLLEEHRIEADYACTLVLLAVGEY